MARPRRVEQTTKKAFHIHTGHAGNPDLIITIGGSTPIRAQWDWTFQPSMSTYGKNVFCVGGRRRVGCGDEFITAMGSFQDASEHTWFDVGRRRRPIGTVDRSFARAEHRRRPRDQRVGLGVGDVDAATCLVSADHGKVMELYLNDGGSFAESISNVDAYRVESDINGSLGGGVASSLRHGTFGERGCERRDQHGVGRVGGRLGQRRIGCGERRATDDKFAWYKNLGNGNFGPATNLDHPHRPTLRCGDFRCRQPVFKDILGVTGSGVIWFENQVTFSQYCRHRRVSSPMNGEEDA